MDAPRNVQCAVHGWHPEAFVCCHIFETLHTGLPVGFNWPPRSEHPHPDAWCNACDMSRVEAGGDWNEELERMLDIRLVCGACYERAKEIWEEGRKVNQ